MVSTMRWCHAFQYIFYDRPQIYDCYCYVFWLLIIPVKTNTYYPHTISAFLELQLLKHHEIRDVEPVLAITLPLICSEFYPVLKQHMVINKRLYIQLQFQNLELGTIFFSKKLTTHSALNSLKWYSSMGVFYFFTNALAIDYIRVKPYHIKLTHCY